MTAVTLVVNPAAGKGRAQELLPQVAGVLRDAGTDLQILLSRDFAEARSMVTAVAESGADVLAVMGGDGMMHLGVNAAAARPDVTLGLVPAGTGNDLCRGLGLPPGDAVAAAAVIAAGHVRAVDASRVGSRYVGAVVATGFDALVNGRANALPWPKGSLRYPLAVLAELRVFSPLRYRLTVDGAVRDLEAMFVAVGNTAYYGGGLKVCPQADPADGLLDVTIVHPVGRATLLRLFPLMYSGRFARNRAVEQLRARSVRVEGLGLVGFGDGEMLGAAPLDVAVAAGSLRVLVPTRV